MLVVLSKNGPKKVWSKASKTYLHPTSSSGNVVSGPSPQSKVGPRYLNFDLRRIDVTFSDIAGLLMREPERMLQQAGSPDR